MKKRILASILAVVTVFTCSFTAVACSKDKQPEEQANVGIEQTTCGGMVLSESQGNGIKLVSTTLLSSEYEDYGISPMAETAYTLTATITPTDAANHGVNWTITWADVKDSWATGKFATDYVSVTPTADSKVATVSCLQAFGEQIIITATSQDNANVKATCTVDYAQKVETAALNFGNVSINLGGETAIKYEIAEGVQGMGGEVYAEIETSDVYTIAENFTYSVQLSQYAEYVGTGNYFNLNDSTITGAGNFSINTEYYGESIYYDYDHDIVDWLIMGRSEDILFEDMTTAEIAEYFSNITNPGLYQVNFTITGEHNSYSYTSQVYCSGYTNNTPVSALALDAASYIF